MTGVVLALITVLSAAECRPAKLKVCDDQQGRPAPPGDLSGVSAMRRSVVERAAAELGAVSILVDTDCNRKGWRRISEYYATAYGRELSEAEMRILRKAHVEKEAPPKLGDWCGIFAAWAIKSAPRPAETTATASVPGKKDCDPPAAAGPAPEHLHDYLDLVGWKMVDGGGALQGLPRITGHEGLQPGDVVLVQGDMNHHAIVERVVGDRVYTIDGNMDCQMIVRKDRPLSEITGYYRLE